MYPNFGKIGVVLGGLSSEREISLKSGQAIFEALLKEGLDAEEIDLKSEDPKIVEKILKEASIDIVFVAMHGRFGEDGKLQTILEKMNIVYVGSDSLASALAMNKVASRNVFEENSIPVPGYTVLNREKKDSFGRENLFFPLVVKPQSQGSSVGVTFVENNDGIDKAIDLAFNYDDNIIIEEYIKGKELTVGILDNRALEPIEILPKNKFFDFQAKYSKGLTEYILPASIDKELRDKVQTISLKAHKVLGCRHFSRVDLMLDENNNPFILEVNTIPGFTSTSLLPKAALYEGITFPELCIRIIRLAFKDTAPIIRK